MDLGTFLYLSRNDVETINVPMVEIIEALDRMFKEKGEGRYEMPPKPGIHTEPGAFIHAMPAYIPAMKSAGMKWVAGYPRNNAMGLPQITGLLVLNSLETGLPTCVMDCSWITAKRTGAATAVAARYLARPDCSTVGVVACGVQGRSNLEALACLYEIEKVRAYDIVPEAAEKYAREMGEQLGLEIEPVRQVADAVRGMDMVVTCGPSPKKPEPYIPAGWLEEGAFASAVDFDGAWTGEAMREMDKLATDDFGQMDFFRGMGYFLETPQPYADLGEIAAGKAPGRESDAERTMAMNLGLALDDMATAPLIYQKALEMGIGVELPN